MGMNLLASTGQYDWLDRIETKGYNQAKGEAEKEIADLKRRFQEAKGNPVPSDFEVVRWEELENTDDGNTAIVVELRYPSCTNYDGRKVLVFEDAEAFWTRVENDEPVDPHFLEDHVSPVARFEPTDRGWDLALQIAKSLI